VVAPQTTIQTAEEDDRSSAWSLVLRVRENVHTWPRGGALRLDHIEAAF
jgi:hypothetical protein